MSILSNNDQWNPNLYDEKHAFVSQLGDGVLALLAPKQGEYILDVGCGTGDILNEIKASGALVKGVDQSSNMIDQARNKYPDISFHVEDATALTFENEFDAVFSNATLHWIKEPEKALASIYNSLKDGGRFVAEFGGQGNVQQITDAIKTQAEVLGLLYKEDNFPWYFPSIGEYTTLMEEAGFEVTFASLFDRPTPLQGKDGLRNWIEMFCKTMFPGLDDKTFDELILNIETSLKDTMYKDDAWIADYKRIRVIGIKS